MSKIKLEEIQKQINLFYQNNFKSPNTIKISSKVLRILRENVLFSKLYPIDMKPVSIFGLKIIVDNKLDNECLIYFDEDLK